MVAFVGVFCIYQINQFKNLLTASRFSRKRKIISRGELRYLSPMKDTWKHDLVDSFGLFLPAYSKPGVCFIQVDVAQVILEEQGYKFKHEHEKAFFKGKPKRLGV